MSLKIRLAEERDAAQVAELLRAIGWFQHIEAEPTEASAARVLRHLTQCLADDSHAIYVAVADGGEIVGYAAAHWLPCLFLPGPEGFISELFVREEARGAGVGKALLASVIREAQKRGCCRLQLVNYKNRDSYRRAFYEKNGWEERAEAALFVYDSMRV